MRKFRAARDKMQAAARGLLTRARLREARELQRAADTPATSFDIDHAETLLGLSPLASFSAVGVGEMAALPLARAPIHGAVLPPFDDIVRPRGYLPSFAMHIRGQGDEHSGALP